MKKTCVNCRCDQCEAETKRVDPLYSGMVALLEHSGLWEGDAHAVAEMAVDMADWLKHEMAGSHQPKRPSVGPIG